jgi:hypothetical protein
MNSSIGAWRICLNVGIRGLWLGSPRVSWHGILLVINLCPSKVALELARFSLIDWRRPLTEINHIAPRSQGAIILNFFTELQKADDIEQFLDQVQFIVNKIDDFPSWKTILAMLYTLPMEMSAWTYSKKSPGYNNSFEVWKVVRMFRNRIHRPNGPSTLLAFCKRYPERSFEKHLLELYEKNREELVKEHTTSQRSDVPSIYSQTVPNNGTEARRVVEVCLQSIRLTATVEMD